MSVGDFRDQYAAEIAQDTQQRRQSTGAAAKKSSGRARPTKKSAGKPPTVGSQIAEITNRRYGVPRRTKAIRRAARGAVHHPRLMKTLLDLLADPAEKDQVRKAALQAIRANTFHPVQFRRYAPAFYEALRTAATDNDPELRMFALDILALRKDEYAQRLLVEGLRHPRKALVPPVKALQMIGYDAHSEFYPLLRDIAQSSKRRPAVRQMALRLLAADSDSTDIFRTIVEDKNEEKSARVTSAVALQSLAPKEFARLATRLVDDDDDDDDVRASVLTTVTHGPTTPSRSLRRKVREIHEAPGGTRQLNLAADEFTQMQGRATRPS